MTPPAAKTIEAPRFNMTSWFSVSGTLVIVFF